MEAAPSAKPRRGSPPVPPNYVSLRQLQELRLKEKEEQERRQREEEEAAAAAAAAMAKQEAARKAEMVAMAAAAVKRDASRKPETKVGVVPVKEKRDGGIGPQWVAVAHRPVVPPPARRESVPEAVPIGVGRGNKGPAEGKTKVERKEKVDESGKAAEASVTSAQTRAADESAKPAEASAHGCKPEKKGDRKGKASGDTGAEPVSIGGSGESTGAPYRQRKNPKWKKGAGGRSASAEPSADSTHAKTAGASPPQGVKPENAGKPKSPGPKRADASPVSDSSRGKKADATPASPTSAATDSVGELRLTVETKPEGLVEGHRQPPAAEVHGASVHKPRVVSRRRLPGDRCSGVREQHGRVWVPKATTGCAELTRFDE